MLPSVQPEGDKPHQIPMLAFLDHLRFARLRIGMEALDPVALPAYPGAVLRGGFGRALEMMGRTMHMDPLFRHIFDTWVPNPPREARGVRTAPRPYALAPPFRHPLRPENSGERQLFAPGEVLWFGLTLTGEASQYFPYFVLALEQMARRGLGPGRGRLRLVRVKDVQAGFEDLYDPEERVFHPCRENDRARVEQWRQEAVGAEQVAVTFRTPTRMVVDHRLLRPEELNYRTLVSQLFNRVFLQVKFHCQLGVERDSWPEEVEPCTEGVKVVERDLMWYDWERHSFRQKTMILQGGFVGRVVLAGQLEPLFPLLRAGEVLHVGKETTVGMGNFALERLA